MDEGKTIRRLEQKLAARDKTIAVLMQRVEHGLEQKQTSFAVFEQNLALEQIVARKTRQIHAQRAELEKLVDDLRATQTQLLQAQKLEAIGQLAAGIAHEINTPTQYVSDNVIFLGKAFGKISDVLELAEELVSELAGDGEVARSNGQVVEEARQRLRRARLDYLREQVPKAIAQSREGLQRITTIVKAMKDFSHPSAGSKERIDLHQAIATTLTVARNEWKYVADVVTEFDESLPLVPCLRDELNQVVLNLVVNAAHGIAEAHARSETEENRKGTITVRTRRLAEMAEISVEDTGCGIPEAHRARIFEPFFTTKPVGKGTGQGLAIAYSVVVDKHQGTIFFESTEGVGTTFFLRIPLESQGSEAPQESP